MKEKKVAGSRCFTVVLLLLGLAAPATADAFTEFHVDRTDDTTDAACTPAPNDCSLRGALADSGNITTGSLVSLPAGVFRRDPPATPIVIQQSVTIAGAGAGATVIEGPNQAGQGATLSFQVQAGQTTPNTSAIRDVTITKGVDYNGGGILSLGTNLSLDRVAVTGNTASVASMFGSHGAGIDFKDAGRTLTIDHSVISGNHGEGVQNGPTSGTGVTVSGGSATIRDSTIAQNVADGHGGTVAGAGLAATDGGSIALDRVTVAGNQALDAGAQLAVGNIWRDSASTITTTRSIIADGSAPAGSGTENCSNLITSQGQNVEDRDQCGLGASDRRNANVGLGPLADNGGPTKTQAITKSSAAFDFAGDCLSSDQRDQPPAFAACDSGAFELQPSETGPGGSPGNGIPPGPQGGTSDTTKPALRALSLSPRQFRAAGSGPAIAARTGTTVRYSLSERAAVKFRIERALPGRRAGKRCVRPSHAHRSAKTCIRHATMRGSFTDLANSGANAFNFRGRLRGRKLPPGRYRLKGVATDPARNVSAPKRSREFQVLRPR